MSGKNYASFAIMFISLCLASSPLYAKKNRKRSAPAKVNVEAEESVGSYRKKGIDVVQGRQFRKRGRFELSGSYGINADNQYLFYQFLQPRLTYHLREGIAIEASYGRAFSQERNIIDDLANIPCTEPLFDQDGSQLANCGVNLDPAPDPIQNMYFGSIVWSPIYGKFALFSKKIFHFDVYFLAGAGLFDNRDSSRFGVNTGLGTKIFLNDSVSMRLEVRNYTVREGAPFNQIANNRVYSIGASVFFPKVKGNR